MMYKDVLDRLDRLETTLNLDNEVIVMGWGGTDISGPLTKDEIKLAKKSGGFIWRDGPTKEEGVTNELRDSNKEKPICND